MATLPTSLPRGKPALNVPRSEDAEAGALACALNDAACVAPVAALPSEAFNELTLRTVHGAIVTLHKAGRAVDVVTVADALRQTGQLDEIGGIPFLSTLPDRTPSSGNLSAYMHIVGTRHAARQAMSAADDVRDAIAARPDSVAGILAAAVRSFDDARRSLPDDQHRATLLEQREFRASIEPPQLRPIYSLSASVISTPGNLTTITSAVKTGKSAVVGAMMASAMADGTKLDLLSFTSCNPNNRALLHFDSEQAPDDHWHGVNRALNRAGRKEPPPWLHSYCLTGLGFKRGWQCVQDAVRAAADKQGGVHSILLDGAADFVADVNDAAESNDFVAELHEIAIEHDCPIVTVIHFNPGSEKVRGHLGSQLERKAETNLRLDKTDGVTTIWSDKQRRAPIPKGTGPCFQWSDEGGMHVSVQSFQASKDDQDRETLKEVFADVFSSRPSMRYSDLQVTVKSGLTVSEKTAERKIKQAVKLNVIKKSAAGLYILST